MVLGHGAECCVHRASTPSLILLEQPAIIFNILLVTGNNTFSSTHLPKILPSSSDSDRLDDTTLSTDIEENQDRRCYLHL